MSARTWGIYNATTGLFRASYSGPEGTIDEQLRDGEAAIEGTFDTGLQWVNPETQAVEARIPPSPGPEYQWEGARWVLTPAAALAMATRAAAAEQIKALEASQARVVREFILGVPDAKERLTTIEEQIVSLRPDLNSPVRIESTD